MKGRGNDGHAGQGGCMVDSRTQGQVFRLCPKVGIIQRKLQGQLALTWMKTMKVPKE